MVFSKRNKSLKKLQKKGIHKKKISCAIDHKKNRIPGTVFKKKTSS